jgi:DNA mismatch endonuclease, patch repair protein
MHKRRRTGLYRPKEPDEVYRNMSSIRSVENKTEKALRSELHKLGLRFRKYRKDLPGKPDIVFVRPKVAVFVDGDYWHGRLLREIGIDAQSSYFQEKQRTYWLPKLQRTVERDAANSQALISDGWHVLRYWESDVKRDISGTAAQIARCVAMRTARKPT